MKEKKRFMKQGKKRKEKEKKGKKERKKKKDCQLNWDWLSKKIK